jgi:hypothetical protein
MEVAVACFAASHEKSQDNLFSAVETVLSGRDRRLNCLQEKKD